jgi:phytoene/squalene synthetase
MLETESHIELDSSTIERGYKSCRGAVKKFFKGNLWYVNNIPGEERRALDAILFNLMRTIDLLDLESASGLSLDVWFEIRDELSDAFRDRCSTVELAALVDACRKFDVPKQFLFDPLRGADLWIRNREFKTWNELDAFSSFVGGSSLASIVPALGTVRDGWQVSAMQAGKAIMLTQILSRVVTDLKQNKTFLAIEDLEKCQVEIPYLKLRRETKSFRHLVRLYTSRIEKLFVEGGQLVNFMDFDGKRSIKSLLGYHWKLMTKMKIDPSLVLREEGVFSLREQLTLKSRHLMGMEYDTPIFPADDGHH